MGHWESLGKAPVQSSHRRIINEHYHSEPDPNPHPSGWIDWAEHCEAWDKYNLIGTSQSAEKMAERWGFSYAELVWFLGHEPKTWRER